MTLHPSRCHPTWMCSGLDLHWKNNLPIIARVANFGNLGIMMGNDIMDTHSIFVNMNLCIVDFYVPYSMSGALCVQQEFPCLLAVVT